MELERQFEKIYVDINMRKEDMPQPVDMKQLEITQSNLEEDADLDLTVINDEPINNQPDEPVKSITPQPQIEQNKISKETEGILIEKPPISKTVPNEQKDQSVNTQTSLNSNKNQSERENLALKNLLEKIKKQREESAQKCSIVDNNISLDDSSASDLQPVNTEQASKPKEVEKVEIDVQNKSKLSNNSSSEKIEIGLIKDMEDEEDLNLNDEYDEEELSYSISLNSNTPKSDIVSKAKEIELNKQEKSLFVV